ncbi:MAG: F0F1-type ATP synthase assembly protein I [Myxococcota bacterium]
MAVKDLETRRLRRRRLVKGMSHASIGIEMGVSVGVGYAMGRWLDQTFGTSWLTITMTLVGVVAGFRALFLVAYKHHKETEAQEQEDNAGGET